MTSQAVFFDLYGTLLIYGDMFMAWEDWLTALYEGLTESGLSMSKAALAQACDGFFSRPQPPWQDDGMTVYERRLWALGFGLGLNLNSRDLQQISRTSVDAWQNHILLDPETVPVLATLKSNKTLALVSNFEHPPHVYALLAKLGLTGYFETIVISGDVGFEKPDPRIFSPALQQTRLQPSKVMYVGDTLDDVRGARAAGLCPILIRRDGTNQVQVAADYRANQQQSRSTPSLPTTDDAKTIRRLSELVEITR